MGKGKKADRGTFTPHPSPLVDSVSQYRETPAQALMRQEMSEPKKLSGVLDEVMGPYENPDITQEALQIISGTQDLNLSFAQWTKVQAMVEEGIRRGIRAGRVNSGW